jgi:hypothetical protein
VEIEDGHIRDAAILEFQGRSAVYPYPAERRST